MEREIFRSLYNDAGRIVEMLSTWKCTEDFIPDCMRKLADEFVSMGFWLQADADYAKLVVLRVVNSLGPG